MKRKQEKPPKVRKKKRRKKKGSAQVRGGGPLVRKTKTSPSSSGGKRRVVVHDADAQDLLGAHQDQILRLVRHVVEAQVVGLLEVQRGVRARDAPARLAHASDDAVEVPREEDGDLGVRLVHLDPQDAVLVSTTLWTREEARKEKVDKRQRHIKQRPYGGGGNMYTQSWRT